MNRLLKNNNSKKILLGVLFLLLGITSSFGQFGGGSGTSIVGPSTTNAGDTELYQILTDITLSSTTWSTFNAQVTSSTTSNAYIKFNTAGGASVTATSYGFFFDMYTASTIVNVQESAPATPGSPTISNNNCGEATLTRSGTPSGATWYWQGKTPAGTSTTKGSGSTYTANEGSGYYYIRARNSNGTWSVGSGVVYVNIADFSPGSIDGVQTVCYSGDPSTINNTSSPSGGDGYSYQWQYSNNGSSGWTNIGGATTSGYNPPSGLTADRWYRRRVISCGETKYTNTVKVTVSTALSAGSITGTQTVCYNDDPGILSNSAIASGGGGSYSYQWQYSNNGSSGWTNISGATSSSYDPAGNLTADRWYRRRVSAACGETKYTSNVKVTVNPSLQAGSINGTQTLCYNTSPSILGNVAVASGGDGSYAYQWQYSNDGSSNWTNISGATSTSYNPPSGLTASRWYRRSAASCGQTKYTATVAVTVTAQIAIPSAPSITNNCASTVLTRSTPPSGITWYWQSSATGTSTANSNASITLSSGSTYYLRGRNSNGCWGAARTINYSITPPSTWYADNDGDGYGNASVSTTNCSQPAGYVSNDDDYDDTTANITNIPPQNFYGDADGDGFGDPAISVYYSTAPSGYVSNNNDLCPQTPGDNNGCDYVTPTRSDENYIYTRAPQVAMSSIDDSQILENSAIIDQITYFDGLGRTVQNIGVKASPAKKDLITHTTYDQYGRQAKEYLPYENTAIVGSYKAGDQALATQQFYKNLYPADFSGLTEANTNAYSETLFENSPLNRPLKQAAPGEAWKMGSGHEIKFEYQTNVVADSVKYYKVSFNGGNTEAPELVDSNIYPEGELFKNTTKDENWQSGQTYLKDHTTEEYINKEGQVLLKRTYDQDIAHDTYYVYDDFGNLTYVLPPKVDSSVAITTSVLNELCYQYKYDDRNRLIEKKIPGKDWEYIIYNKLDQPVMTQDANRRKDNSGLSTDQWLFTKYDAFGRVAFTGLVNSDSSRGSLQNFINTTTSYGSYVTKTQSSTSIAGTAVYYSNDVVPSNGSTAEVHTINYYDTYNFDLDGISLPTGSIYGQAITTNTQGLPTGSKVRILGTNNWITTITLYDAKGRPIYVVSKNQELGTTDIIESKLDFPGKVLEIKSTHIKDSNAPIVVTERFEYDHATRLIRQTHQIGSGPEEVIVENTYDEIGQLVQKGVGNAKTSTNRLQTVDYSYNVRGWLKTINDVNNLGNDLFSFKINYNDPTSGTALYNGNISQTHWATASQNDTDNPVSNQYTYSYDALNRIKSAIDNTGHYNLNFVNYDKNGNITELKRQGARNPQATSFGTMDDLDYIYLNGGNKLVSVDDTIDDYGFKNGANVAIEYEYDDNGNMTIDRNKGITSITYNHLNLPTNVVMANGNIQYIYDAAGIKIKKIVNNTSESSVTTTEYAGSFIYENSSLQFFNHAEGYIEPENNNYQYVYQYRDHLGNIRLSYADNNNDGLITTNEVRKENNYYPYGLLHQGYNSNQSGRNHKFDYLNQERQDELGLGWISYKWRNADPALGRFFGSDPITEKYYYQANYQFASNNPVWKIEIEGLEGKKTNNGTDLNDDSFLVGWNREVNKFNANFFNGVNDFFDNPLKSIGNGIHNTMMGAGQLLADVTGLSGVLGIENKTGNAIVNGIETAIEFPSMTNEQKGAVTFGAFAFLTEAIVSKKFPVKSFADLPGSGTINPNSIRFSQNSIKAGFQDKSKGTIFDLTEGLKNGTIDPSDIPAIRLVEKDGKVFTLDNRRLKAFQDAGIDVRFETVDFNSLSKKDLDKFTTTNDGTSIEIRGQN